MHGMDLQTRRVLEAVLRYPLSTLPALAAHLEMPEEAVAARLRRMESDGILHGFRAQVDAAKLGYPHELLVQGAPSDTTTRQNLESLCGLPAVTRVFALASRNSIAFTVRGDDVEELHKRAREAASMIGIVEAQYTLIVDTLHDDPALAMGRAMAPTAAP